MEGQTQGDTSIPDPDESLELRAVQPDPIGDVQPDPIGDTENENTLSTGEEEAEEMNKNDLTDSVESEAAEVENDDIDTEETETEDGLWKRFWSWLTGLFRRS